MCLVLLNKFFKFVTLALAKITKSPLKGVKKKLKFILNYLILGASDFLRYGELSGKKK